jgi:hypothetical protein
MLEKVGFQIIKYQKHWQTLNLDYILYRIKPYSPLISDLGRKGTRVLGLQQVQVPYWMGQSLVLARRLNTE